MDFARQRLIHEMAGYDRAFYIESTLPLGVTIDEYRRARPRKPRRRLRRWFR